MIDYTRCLPHHIEKYIGENDLFLEVYESNLSRDASDHKPPLLFVHGAYTGSWMWSKFIPHFIYNGWKCYVMNLRSHYKSRIIDMTKVSFEDYLQDIKEIISLIHTECGVEPILIGFSMGGILCQKVAETEKLAGLILIDSSICKEVNELVPYDMLHENTLGNVIPAPERLENSSIDESEEDIEFQRKYLSMESSKVFAVCACWIKGIKGISINNQLISCPSFVIKSVNNEEDDRRGKVEAKYLGSKYKGFWNATHTGLLIGQRYKEIVDSILDWLRDMDTVK